MALDKLVDSSQLDADLASVANAIRTKGGTSAQLAFPDGFVSAVQAIPTGGAAPTLVTKSITANGTYNASSDNADGYSSVTVNVQASGTNVIHVQYIASADALSTSAGGNTLAYYNNYISPNIAGLTEYVCWTMVTNNTATGNYAKSSYHFGNSNINSTNKYVRTFYRGSGATGSSNYTTNQANNYDFFYTAGSIIDVWVIKGALPT